MAVEEAGSRCDGQAGSDLETQVHPVFGSLDPREIMALFGTEMAEELQLFGNLVDQGQLLHPWCDLVAFTL